MSPAEYRARQTVVAVGLSIVGLACGLWLIGKAVVEFTGCCPHPEAGQ